MTIPFSLLLLILALAPNHNTIPADVQQELDIRSEQVKQQESLSARDWFARGQAAYSHGDLQAAADAWKLALQYGAPPGSIYPCLVEAHFGLGDLDSLADDLKALVSHSPSDPAWHYQLGLVQIILQPESARGHLLLAAESDPDLGQSVRLLERGLRLRQLSDDPAFRMVASGRALASVGEWELASAAFSRATRLDPVYAEAWAFLGEAHRQLGEDGLAELQKAVVLNSQSVAANTLLGLYWQQSGRLDMALVYLDAAAQHDQDNPILQGELGELLAQQGNLPAALLHFQRAAEAAPGNPVYWRSLAVFTIEYDFQVEEVGLPAARTAVLLDDKDATSLDTMAQVYISLGYPSIAQRFLYRSLAVEPEFAPARLHLGLVDLLEGNPSAARRHFHQAAALAPAGSETAEHTRRLLLNLQQ